ncbi:MAG: aminopeptidase [Bacteroidetes bacterium]|nr:aminopeptidase [Bacteroidota bacterium]
MRQILFWIKRFLQLVFVILLLLGLWNYKLVNYAISQAKGQLKIIWNTEAIEDVLASSQFPDSLKSKLLLIAEIKKYAEDSLGIKKSENYSTFYDQKGHTLMWMLMASEAYEMKAKEWHFPLLGDFSYKGYFDKKKARLEQYELSLEGYDTELGRASGWSTLGWFKDPVLSSMLYYSKGELASLIIHELTHGTLYVKNDVNFNENLASFIGEKGAEKFLVHQFGKRSEALANYKSSLTDERIFEKYLVECTRKLKELYAGMNHEPDEVKKIKKQQMIHQFVVDAYKLPLERPRKYAKRMKGAILSGNAFFMSYERYDGQKDSLENVLNTRYQGDIKLYLKDLKTKFQSL